MTRACKHAWLHKSLWLSAKVVSDLSVLLGLKTASCFQEETSGNFISISGFADEWKGEHQRQQALPQSAAGILFIFTNHLGHFSTGHPGQFFKKASLSNRKSSRSGLSRKFQAFLTTNVKGSSVSFLQLMTCFLFPGQGVSKNMIKKQLQICTM